MDIYIVDDAEITRERMAAALTEIAGARVVGQAGSVAAAKSGLDQQAADLVIIDVRLPDGTGFDLLDWLRSTHPDTHALVISSEAYPQYRQRAHRAGVEFFDKAADCERLWAAVALLAASSTRQRAH
jgi:DNA-binding NarL/FixJ family response regulator